MNIRTQIWHTHKLKVMPDSETKVLLQTSANRHRVLIITEFGTQVIHNTDNYDEATITYFQAIEDLTADGGAF